MLDIGWSELLLVGVVALIVVGPKELPRLMRTVGRWISQARSLTREFQRGMDDVAREADLKELADAKAMLRDVQSMKQEAQAGLTNPTKWAKDALADTVGDIGTEASPVRPASGTTPAVTPLTKPGAPTTEDSRSDSV